MNENEYLILAYLVTFILLFIFMVLNLKISRKGTKLNVFIDFMLFFEFLLMGVMGERDVWATWLLAAGWGAFAMYELYRLIVEGKTQKN